MGDLLAASDHTLPEGEAGFAGSGVKATPRIVPSLLTYHRFRSILLMQVKVVASCRPECGVLVQGDVETTSREFIHRFLFPARATGAAVPPRTEVDEMRLVTFSPDSKDWSVDCPVCGNPIRFDSSIPSSS